MSEQSESETPGSPPQLDEGLEDWLDDQDDDFNIRDSMFEGDGWDSPIPKGDHTLDSPSPKSSISVKFAERDYPKVLPTKSDIPEKKEEDLPKKENDPSPKSSPKKEPKKPDKKKEMNEDEQLDKFLKDLGLRKYYNKFIDHDITFLDLRTVSNRELQDIFNNDDDYDKFLDELIAQKIKQPKRSKSRPREVDLKIKDRESGDIKNFRRMEVTMNDRKVVTEISDYFGYRTKEIDFCYVVFKNKTEMDCTSRKNTLENMYERKRDSKFAGILKFDQRGYDDEYRRKDRRKDKNDEDEEDEEVEIKLKIRTEVLKRDEKDDEKFTDDFKFSVGISNKDLIREILKKNRLEDLDFSPDVEPYLKFKDRSGETIKICESKEKPNLKSVSDGGKKTSLKAILKIDMMDD